MVSVAVFTEVNDVTKSEQCYTMNAVKKKGMSDTVERMRTEEVCACVSWAQGMFVQGGRYFFRMMSFYKLDGPLDCRPLYNQRLQPVSKCLSTELA